MASFHHNRKQSRKSNVWLFGLHTVKAALLNPKRHNIKLLLRDEKALEQLCLDMKSIDIEYQSSSAFDQMFGTDSVHQNIAVLTEPLAVQSLEELSPTFCKDTLIIILDNVSDPHNVGAILRSAAAFGASAVLTTSRNSPASCNTTLAKIACGALEHISIIEVSNLARALDYLKKDGFWIFGFDETGSTDISQHSFKGKTAFVFGSEGHGLRRLTQQICDMTLRLPTLNKFSTLNVSMSVTTSLYEWRRQQTTNQIGLKN